MVEPPALREIGYQRGQAVLRRWGWPAGICGIVGWLIYLGLMFVETRHPDPDKGRVYAILSLRKHSALFTYGTLTEATLAYGGLVAGVLGLAVFLVLRSIHDPAANPRSPSAPAPKGPVDWP